MRLKGDADSLYNGGVTNGPGVSAMPPGSNQSEVVGYSPDRALADPRLSNADLELDATVPVKALPRLHHCRLVAKSHLAGRPGGCFSPAEGARTPHWGVLR